MFRVYRLDFWEYRHPTGWEFDDENKALQKAEELDKANIDPLSCYIVQNDPVVGHPM